MMKNIGIIIELDNGRIKESNFGMITLARQKDTMLFAFVAGNHGAAVKEDLEAFGITRIVNITLAGNQVDNPVAHMKAVIELIKAYDISAVLGLSTAAGKDLLPRIAASLDAPLVMDCVQIDLEQHLVQTSQYSGKTMATIKMTGEFLVLGVRPNAVEPIEEKASATLENFDGNHLVSQKLSVVKTGNGDTAAAVNLAEADVIISGGRGMKNGENFALLSQCAEQLNAAVGASRVAVDSGWVPYAMQVGQTGEKVSPRVYIACGISGSIQHFAGMKASGMVIAINTDENAAMMANCDYYVKADALDIIPALTHALENE